MIWKQRLVRSMHLSRSKAESRYVQLATYSESQGVQNRTVVFRGFSESGLELYFVTEKDSDKVRALAHHSQAEIVWYFAKSREQYRLNVQCVLLDSQTAAEEQACRQRVWAGLSEAAKTQFNPQENSVPDNFIVSVCTIRQVDYLYLGQPHERYLYQGTKNWKEQRVSV